jgi:hypothetical protein
MVSFTVHFGFIQRFPFPARAAYDWCTDYAEGDLELEGLEGSRRIERTDEDTVILTDTLRASGKEVTKVKMVRLYPELLTWTNTRISEPGRYSQFLYHIVPEGDKASRLDYEGAQIEEAKKMPSPAEIRKMVDSLTKEDSAAWVNLAEAMKRDLGKSSRRGK